MKQESAETIAIQALAWLAAQDDLFGTFLGASGAAAGDVAAQAGDPVFLGSVLDFLLMNDDWVIGFCDAHRLPYTAPQEARFRLPGGEQVHWT